MKTTDYLFLLQNPQNISSNQTSELEVIINSFPYFQSARALHLKGLKQQENFSYNQELKKTAAYTTDRSILFNYITSEDFVSTNNTQEKTIITALEVIDSKVVKALHKEINKHHPTATNTTTIDSTFKAEKLLEIDKPLSFHKKETHSFNEWLQLAAFKPIQREVKAPNKLDLIDSFIEKNPRIPAIKKTSTKPAEITSKNELDKALMTETLAKVYVAQQKFENAMTAYRILSLKYPEKSGFFADRIKAIELLQKNKS